MPPDEEFPAIERMVDDSAESEDPKARTYADVEARLREELLPDLEIIRSLGFGSMAGVYLAREVLLRRLVAIKLLGPHVARLRKARVRFEREAQSAARIAHPNVVTVYRAGALSDATPYLVMRYIRGTTLEERLQGSGPFDLDTGVEIISQMAAALAAAHHLGIVHRDVKPSNILYEEGTGRAFLSDFGLVSILASGDDSPERITTQGHIVGEMRYSSPEELRGEEVSERSDVYTLGITAYELLAGEGPYGTTGRRNVVAGHLQMEPVPLGSLVDGSTADLDDLLLRCLSKQPATRPSAADVAHQLGGRRLSSLHLPEAVEVDAPPEEPAPTASETVGKVTGADRFPFTTLGSTDLRSSSGRGLSSVLSQPKRVALLAYLGLGVRGGLVRRDTLMAMFWPTSTTEKARHSLRQSIYVLRRALGPDVVVSRGDEELGVDQNRLEIDVAAFEALLAGKEFESAMEVYAGEFLPGFYVPDAPDFQYWLHSERQRLRELASQAAWNVAEQKESEADRPAATSWSRRAAELAPFDEALQRETVRMLERLGDRVGAMQAYDQFAERLRSEYEMEPGPEMQELADRIRSGDT